MKLDVSVLETSPYLRLVQFLWRCQRVQTGMYLIAGSRRRHRTRDFAEDFAEADRDTGHHRTGRNRDKPGHQCVFEQVLAVIVRPDSQRPNRVDGRLHAHNVDYRPMKAVPLMRLRA
jgi:hypothetical protein